MAELIDQRLEHLHERLQGVSESLQLSALKERIEQAEHKSAQPGFWDDAAAAQKEMSVLAGLKHKVSSFEEAQALYQDAQTALEMAQEDSDFMTEAEELAQNLEAALTQLELESWFTQEFDEADAIVTITPGQGGLEAQDWVGMLFRMYLKYAENSGYKVEVNDAPAGEVIGLDRATFTVKGLHAYGMLRAEAGVHRLVRISPTDAKKRRQTTFAGVEVLPVLPDDVEVDINPQDLRIDVYHASGPGGQGVNTTDSAVRITHLPTGIVVTCQNERSQLQNKAICMQILRSKLYERELEKREAALDELRGPKHEIGFGNQIRSYVLYPYQMVKDLRTGTETGNVSSVLEDGNLEPFIVAYHRWQAAGAPLTDIQDD